MASGGITGKTFSLEALFHGRMTYAIEYYQREYAWGPDEVSTLITDLVGEFERTSGSRRSRWASPVQYFLGPFVYADEDGDRRYRAWHIEHLFPDHADQHPVLTPRRFRALRNRIGGLGLLPGPDNSSVRDEPFPQKTSWYRQHNTLLAVLSPGFQNRNPRLNKLRTSHHLEGLLRDFGSAPALEEVVEVRGQLYTTLARKIWNPAELGLTLPDRPQEPATNPPPPLTESPRPARPPARGRRTELQRLLAAGRLKPDTRLHGTHRGTRHEVRLDDEGRLWLDDDAYRLPDDAGKTATGRKTCAGWKFWHVDLADGTAVPLGDFRDNPSLIIRSLE